MKIELILLGIIGAVFLADFMIKGFKKKTESNELEKVYDEKNEPQKKITVKPIYFLFAFLASVFAGIITTYLSAYFYRGIISPYEFFEYLFPLEASDYFNFFLAFAITFILTSIYIYNKTIFSRVFSIFSRVFSYVLKRKKNITLFIISIPTIKVLIHFFFYRITFDRPKRNGLFQADLGEHIDLLFEQNFSLFIPAIIIPSLIVWYFNDKIKAR